MPTAVRGLNNAIPYPTSILARAQALHAFRDARASFLLATPAAVDTATPNPMTDPTLTLV